MRLIALITVMLGCAPGESAELVAAKSDAAFWKEKYEAAKDHRDRALHLIEVCNDELGRRPPAPPMSGVPGESRTHVSALKGPRPRPLDDGDVYSTSPTVAPGRLTLCALLDFTSCFSVPFRSRTCFSSSNFNQLGRVNVAPRWPVGRIDG